LNQTWKDRGREIFRPAGRFLAARRVSPDHLTILGVCLSLLAALLLGRGSFFAAGFVLLLAGLCDILDGDVARERGLVSPFGAFLDSTLDRVSEGALYIGLAYFYFTRSQTATVWMRGMFEGSAEWGDADGPTLGVLALSTLILSFLVSYTRARAEALGLKGDVGIGSRAERVVVITAGLVLAPWGVLPWAIVLLTVTAWVTVCQRILSVRKQLNAR